jgi:mRNA interferase RelE/StbE
VDAYRLRIKTSAAKELDAVDRVSDRQRIVRRIETLAHQPRPQGCQKLAGGDDRYRIRQGRFRVVYSVDDRARIVTVFKIGDRRDVYR